MLDENKHPEGLKEWFASGGSGASAKAIVAHLTGFGEETGYYPLDAGDFGRCERLLEMVPDLRGELHRMAEVNDYWAALVPVWGQIKVADDQTAAIREIVRPIQKGDPSHIQMGEGVHARFGHNSHKADQGAKADGPRMKETPEDEAVRDKAYRVTADELRQFVERAERLDAEKRDIAEQSKEVFAEAKARGYDTKALRKIIALRKREPDDIAEEEAVLDLYKEALGM